MLSKGFTKPKNLSAESQFSHFLRSLPKIAYQSKSCNNTQKLLCPISQHKVNIHQRSAPQWKRLCPILPVLSTRLSPSLPPSFVKQTYHLSRLHVLDSTGRSHGTHKPVEGPVQIFIETVEIGCADALDSLPPRISGSSPQRLIKFDGLVWLQWARGNTKAEMCVAYESVHCTFRFPACECKWFLATDEGQKNQVDFSFASCLRLLKSLLECMIA